MTRSQFVYPPSDEIYTNVHELYEVPLNLHFQYCMQSLLTKFSPREEGRNMD